MFQSEVVGEIVTTVDNMCNYTLLVQHTHYLSKT
jgi:hypothetical protein